MKFAGELARKCGSIERGRKSAAGEEAGRKAREAFVAIIRAVNLLN